MCEALVSYAADRRRDRARQLLRLLLRLILSVADTAGVDVTDDHCKVGPPLTTGTTIKLRWHELANGQTSVAKIKVR
jgi:hypothetical protein